MTLKKHAAIASGFEEALGGGARARRAARDRGSIISIRGSLPRACATVLCVVALACAASPAREPTGAGGREPEHGGGGGEQGANPATDAAQKDAGSHAMHTDAGVQAMQSDAPQTDHHPADAFGYAVVGADVFPPLYERVEALACKDDIGLPKQCTTDDDCGRGFACLCGLIQGLGLIAGQCVPAECRSGADCGGGRCLLSIGSRANDCCAFGHLGFFCSRSASTCRDGADCTGNGIACIYVDGHDAFECRPAACTCR